MDRFSANSTKILFETGTPAVFKELEYLMEVPELGGAPEKIDVTTLSDSVKKYVPGIKDLGDLVFKFLYDNSSATSNYRVLKGFEEVGKSVKFKIEYPDGATHAFSAIPAVKMDAAAINGALTFNTTMILQSDITVTNPTV